MLTTFGSFTSAISKSFNNGPPVPTNLAVVSVSGSSVTLSFTPPSNLANVTGYLATTSTGAQGSSLTSPITISGLTPTTTYTASVVAIGLSGTSGPSNTVTFTTGLGQVGTGGTTVNTGSAFVHTFTSSGTFVLSQSITVSTLIVGGGGGGGYGLQGYEGPGGGGGGGVGVGTFLMAAGTYTITVGGGGSGGINTSATVANSGGNSSVVGGGLNEIAYGGGYGGSNVSGSGQTGGIGGSGGGGSSGWGNSGYGTANKGTGTLTYYGNQGQRGYHGGAGGGGGGATGAGGVVSSSSSPGGAGGSGYTWSFNGTTYGGGGGGGGGGSSYGSTAGGAGGSGGGGAGAVYNAIGSNGATNTGGGGGGGSGQSQNGGAGGSGVVIITYSGSGGGGGGGTNTGVPTQPAVSSIVTTAISATIAFNAPANVTTGSTYYLLQGSTVIGTSTHPTTAISVSNLTPNNNYNYYLVAKNAFGNSVIKGVVSLLTSPLSPVIELLSVTSTTATINVVNFGTSLSVSNSLTVYPSTGVSVTNNGSLYTLTGLSSSSNYFIGTVTSNTAGYANNALGQLTNTSALIPVAATANVPTISAFGQYICLGCYGNGIYVSNNYGATFTQIVSEANASQSAISDSGRYMYVACNNVGRLYWSNNYGVSFVQVFLGANISCITCSILGNNVFASDATNGGFYYSTNYGVNWSSLVTVAPQTTAIKTNFAGTVTYMTSTSNGRAYSYNLLTNTATAYSPGGGTNVSSVAASADGQYIYLTNYGGLCYVSNNAGASFAAISTTYLPSANYASVVCDTTGQYVYLHNGTTTLYYSSNYGTTFSSTAINTAINNLYLNSNANYLTMSSGSGIYISTASFLLTVPPAPPTNLVDISNTVSTALVSFTPTSGNLAITGYTALTNPFGGVGTGTPSAYTLNNLLINTDYTVAIAASNSGGTSVFSSPMSFSTLPGGTPSPLSPYWTPNYSNIVSYFKFDDASGSTTVVESIAGNNGTTQAGVTFGNGGIANTCAAFNGNNQYITVPYQVLNNLAAGTILCWIYPLALNNMTIFVKQRDGSNTYSALTIGTYPSTGGVQTVGTPGTVYFHSKNSQTVAAAASTTILTTNTWYHIGVTFNASTINIYINGQLDSSTTTSGSVPAETAPTSTTIGGWYASGTLISRFKGYMDDFSVWNIAQTSANIATIYATQLLGTGKGAYVPPLSFVLDSSFGALVQATNTSSYYINSGYSKATGFNYTSFPNWNISYSNASIALANGSNPFFTATMPTGTTQAFVFQVNGNYPTPSYGVLSQMVFINAVGNYTLNFATIPTALTDPSYISLTAMIGGYSTSATLVRSNTAWNNVIMPFTAASIGNYNLLFYFALSPNYLNVAVNSAISLTAVGIIPAFTVPTNLLLTGVTSTTASLTFTGAVTSSISATSYSPSIGTGTGSPATYTVSGLPPNTNSVVYLVANYPAGFYSTGTSLGGPSQPSLPIAVFTAPAAPVLTYISSTISSITVSIANSGTGTITGYSLSTVPNSGSITSSGTNAAYVISGLLSNTVYTLNLSAINSAGTSPNGTLTVTTVPSPPTSVTGTVLNDSMISVSFNAPSGSGIITQYTVTSSPGNIVTTGTASPLTVSGLAANTAYTFTVTARNVAGTSTSSDPSTAVTTNPVPNSPTNLAVTATTSSSVTVSFTVPTGVINGYVLSTSTGAQATGTTSPITINGLAAATTYTINCRAVNYNGISAASSTVSATTGAASLFSSDGSTLAGWTLGANACSINSSIGNPAPSISASGNNASYAFYNLGYSFLNTTITFDVYVGSLCNFYFACNSTGAGQMFRAEGRGSGSGFASTSSWTGWNAPPGGTQFVPGRWYSAKIIISSSGVASWYQNNVLQSQTYNIANNGTYFGLQGDGGGGISYFDNILIVTTGTGGSGTSVATNAGVLSQPVVTGTTSTTSTVTVTFTAPVGAGSGNTYSIVSGGTTYGTASYPATTITASGLTSNTTYAFNLTATNANGTSIPATLITATTQILPPTINTITAVGTTSATINFTAPYGASNGTTYTGSAGGVVFGTVAYPATSIVDASLNPNTTYSFTMTAANATSTSATSSGVSAITVPGPPTNIVGTALNDTSVSITFTPPSGSASISSYTVTNLNNGSTTTGSSSPITVSGLAANTSYSFVMTATNSTGTSVISPSITVTTNAFPNSPTGLALVSSTPVSATVSFTLPSGTISYYTLTTNSGSVPIATGTTSPITLYGLSPSTTYIVTAQSVDSAGTSLPSSTLSITTPSVSTGSVLAAPTIGIASAITTTTAVIGFTAPTGATTGTSYTAYAGGTAYGASVYPSTTVYVTGLQPNTSYLFSVVASNQYGSSSASATLPLVTVPLPPTNLSIVTKTNTSVYLGFTTVSGNATLVGYNAVDASGLYTGTNTTSPIVINGLNPATTYRFTVTDTNTITTTVQSTFSPITLANNILWLDATDPLNNKSPPSNGATLTKWYDKSGLGNNTTAAYGTTPTFVSNKINGLPVVSSVGGGYFGNFSTTYTNSTFSFHLVVIFTTFGSGNATYPYSRLISLCNTTLSADYNNANSFMVSTEKGTFVTLFRNYSTSPWLNSATLTANTPYLVSGYFDGTTAYLGINGTYVSMSSTGNFSINDYGIGVFTPTPSQTTTQSLNQYAEVLFYSTLHATADRQSIEGYLAWKWGINAGLPTNHPYKNISPTSPTVATMTQTSAPSSTVSVTTLLSAPTITSASLISTNTATLNFTAPAGSASGTTYTAGAGGNNYGTAVYPATTIPLTGLSSNTTYSFNIKATNSIGTSAASNAQSVTTVPGPPTNISFNVVSDTAVYVGFTAPTGNATITSYTVTSSPGNLTVSGSATPILFTGLSPSTTYTFTVTVTNSQGVSVSSVSSNPCLTNAVPNCPTNITLTATTFNSITVTFNPPVGTVVSYIISTSTGIVSYSQTSPITLAGLSPSTTYTVSLYTVGLLGTSLPTQSFTVTTLPAPSGTGSILNSPTLTTATSITSTSAIINFTAPSGAASGTVYTLLNGTTGCGANVYPATTVFVSALSSNTVYSFKMTAANSYGTSANSTALSVTTAPSPPTQLTLVSASTNSVTLSFTPPSGSVSLSYSSSVGSGSGTPTSFVVSGLTASTTYSLSIIATNVIGSATSLPITVTTALSPPTNLNARSVTTTGATINFTPPSGITTSTSYTLYVSGQTVGSLNYPNTSFVLTGLLSNTIYNFTVSATNSYGTSSPSIGLYVTTLPIAPGSVTVTGVTSNTISLSMPQPTGNASLLYVASVGTTTGVYNNLLVSGLNSSTPYSFTVTLQNSSGSATSQTINATTALAPPTNLILSTVAATSAIVSFTAPLGASSGTAYSIYNGATVVGTASFPSTTISASGLAADTAYTLTMTATNAIGTSNQSTTINISTLPNPPTSVVATVLTDTYVNVAFTASSGPLAITGYTVTSSPGSITATGTGSPILVTGLSANTAYTFTVTATAAQGTSAPSLPSTAVTTNALPNAPTGLTGTGNTNSSISLSFTAPYGSINSYNYTAVDSSGNTFTGNFAAPATTLTISGLGLGRTYTVTLQSVDAFGTSVASSPLVYATQSYSIVTTGLSINLDSTVGLSGNNWTDQTGNGYNYNFYNSSQSIVNYTTATSNGLTVISLTGSNYMWRNSSTGFNSRFLNSYTFEMWVYPRAKNNATLIYENGQNGFGGWSDDLMGINSSGYFTSYVYNGGRIVNTTGAAYALNTWYQVVNVYDNTARILYQYVNGALKAQVGISRSKPGTMWLVLGAQAGNGSSYMNGLGYFTGYIGAFRGYDIALTAAQVLQNYNAYKTSRYY